MSQRTLRSKVALGLAGLLLALLLAAVFTLGSLRIPFEPDRPGEVLLLYALSTFTVAALLVFGLILTRTLLRLWAERRAGQLGSHFKWKMVLGAMGISLLPVVFMFLISYALMNRTLNRWFPRPLEIATQESQKLLNELGTAEFARLQAVAQAVARLENEKQLLGPHWNVLNRALTEGADAAWTIDGAGNPLAGIAYVRTTEFGAQGAIRENAVVTPHFRRNLPSGVELWGTDRLLFLAARADLSGGALLVGKQIPFSFLERYAAVEQQTTAYAAQAQQLRAFKRQMLLGLLLFTLLLIFSTTWFALFLSKLVTVPIQALAEATQEVARGNLGHRVAVQAQDELGTLVQSFNQMTAQLGDSQKQVQEFNASLQAAIAELDSRRKVMEAILENIPTGVLSLDAEGRILRASPAVARIFGEHGRSASTLAGLLGADAARDLEPLLRKAQRMGTASKEIAVALPGRAEAGGGRQLLAAVTVSALGPRRSSAGSVVVIDDLTEMLRAQKAAAWLEVAQRIAHEIKNPLTPIQLSAQRLVRQLHRQESSTPAEMEALIGECAGLIEREVATLKTLVDEFSQFARFPAARTVSTDLNDIVTGALDVFAGRLDGISVHTSLAPGLPAIKADPELLRRVLVNLIDNAAEAMEGASVRELRLATRLDTASDSVEVLVEDSGHGISPEDKDRLFLPHFSTRARGTGLGLAIASRIIEEHHGTLRAEDNRPAGARFILRLPVVEAAVQAG